MLNKLFLLLLFCSVLHAQEDKAAPRIALGLSYGFGNEFRNIDYSYTNQYIQGQFYYSLNPGRKWEYVVALQPEANFATHQLLNLYFVTPDDPDYIQKREEYTKLKNIREYVLNVAFFAKRKVTAELSLYAMANIGPMIIDTETERLSEGFAFCDVFALGASYSFKSFILDLRPNIRHVSNAGLNRPNSGYNSFNIGFSVIVPLTLKSNS
jgi:hypothetical protein